MYTSLDATFSDILLFLSQDLNLGFGIGIALVSAGLKISCFPLNVLM
jgi:hypothetical protein